MVCLLMNIYYKPKRRVVSGDKFCGSTVTAPVTSSSREEAFPTILLSIHLLSECKRDSTITLKKYKKVKKMPSWQKCQSYCRTQNSCQIFRFKVTDVRHHIAS